MTYQRNNKIDSKSVWLFLAVFVSVCIIYALVLSCSEAKAEWVRLSGFRGIQTNATFQNIPFERARKSVNWMFGGAGELRRMTLDIRNTKPRIENSNPIEWFAPTRNDNQFFFYNGAMQIYHIATDTTVPLTLSYLDDVRTYASDSTIRRNNATNSKWLYLSLSDISQIHVTSSGYDSTYNTWSGPVNDTTWFIKKAARAAYDANPDTVTLSASTVSSSYGPPGVFLANDTTWISDGNLLIKQLGDSTTALTYPTFADTGTTGLVAKYKLYGGSDSVMIIIDSLPDSSISAVATGRHWYQFMVDTMPRGQPVTPYFGADNGSTDTLYFACDTSYWGQYGEAGNVTHIKLRQGAKFVCVATSVPSAWPLVWTDTGKWDYRGTINGLIKWAVWTPNNVGQWYSNIRDFDGRMMIAGGATHPPTRQNIRLFKENDTIKVLVACDLNVGNNTAFRISDENAHIMKMYEWPRQSVASTVQNWNWRISCLHRFRAFYAGNPDTLNQLAWSGDNNYDSIAGTEMLEGDDPITALSSMSDLQIYRRHSIRALQGSDPADFYLVPSPSGVGAVNNATVQRDPYSNTDYFINELGVWNNNGATVSEVPTACPEIFSDSIDWTFERYFAAAIHDRKYFLSCSFAPSANKIYGSPDLNRVVVIDLDGSDVTFFDRMVPLSMYSHKVTSGKSKLFWGDADTTGLVQVDGARDECYSETVWKSAWTDFGDSENIKRIERCILEYRAHNYDSVFVDFYVRNYTSAGFGVGEDSVWTKLMEFAADGSVNVRKVIFPVSRDVVGNDFSIAVRSTNNRKDEQTGYEEADPMIISVSLDVVRMTTERMRTR